MVPKSAENQRGEALGNSLMCQLGRLIGYVGIPYAHFPRELTGKAEEVGAQKVNLKNNERVRFPL